MWPNPQFSVDLVILTEENLNGKIHSLYSDNIRSWLYRSFTLIYKQRHFQWSFLKTVTFHVNDFGINVDTKSTEIWCSWRKSEEARFSKQFKLRWKGTLKWKKIFMWKRVTMEISQCRLGKHSLNDVQQKSKQ